LLSIFFSFLFPFIAFNNCTHLNKKINQDQKKIYEYNLWYV